MKRNNKKGFTIVELVIVIAVIAILSAVLIPTFGSLVTDAQNTARDQEAKNLFTQYLIDHQATAPDGYILVDGYYYAVANNQINLDTEVNTGLTSPKVLAHDTACTYTEGKCTVCGAAQPKAD